MPFFCCSCRMDTDDDFSYYGYCDGWENMKRCNQSRTVSSDLGDMSFMIFEYIKDVMKVRDPKILCCYINKSEKASVL